MVCQVGERHFEAPYKVTKSWNVAQIKIALMHLQAHNFNIRVAILFFSQYTDYFCKPNAFDFVSMGLFFCRNTSILCMSFLSYMVIMTAFTRLLRLVLVLCSAHDQNLFRDNEKIMIVDSFKFRIIQYYAECCKIPFVSWGPYISYLIIIFMFFKF